MAKLSMRACVPRSRKPACPTTDETVESVNEAVAAQLLKSKSNLPPFTETLNA
jgi:hypothetical protein